MAESPDASLQTNAPTRSLVRISEWLVVVNSASFLLTRLINLSVIVWMYQYLLGRIPAEQFAVYPIVAAVMVMAPLFFTSFTGGITRHALDAYARGDRGGVTRIVSSIAPLIWTLSAGFLVLGWIFALHIDRVLRVPDNMVSDARLMMGLLITAFAVQMILVPFQIGFHIRQKFVEMNLVLVGREVLRLVLLLGLMLGLGPQVLWIVVATFIADVTGAIALTIRSRMLVRELSFRRELAERAQARILVSFGLWTSLGQLGNIMYTHAATIVLNLYGTPMDVTVYFIGATVFRQLQALIQTATQPLLPAVTAMQATDDIPRLARTLERGGRYGLWAALLPGMILAVCAHDFVGLYVGDAYVDASIVIVLFMAILPFDRATTLLPMACIAMAKVREFFLPTFLFQLAGLVLMLIFAGAFGWGAIGMGLALFTITVGSQLTYYWGLSLRITQTGFSAFVRGVLVPGWTPALLGAGVLMALRLIDPIGGWIQFGLYAASGGSAYIVAMWFLAMSRDERAKLTSGFTRRARRLGGARAK